MNLTRKTIGGKQFWADVWFFHDWRIQRHALTGHHRLLDGANRRHHSGTYEACREKMDDIRTRDKLPAMQGKAVIVLHGLFRTRTSMLSLSQAVRDTGEYTPFCVSYPTTRGSIEMHARSLDNVIRSLDGVTEINFVAHSLGNLVVRHWLKDLAEEGRALPDGQSFGRMVMLAPPNLQPRFGDDFGAWKVGAIRGRACRGGNGERVGRFGTAAGDTAARVWRIGGRQGRWTRLQSAYTGR